METTATRRPTTATAPHVAPPARRRRAVTAPGRLVLAPLTTLVPTPAPSPDPEPELLDSLAVRWESALAAASSAVRAARFSLGPAEIGVRTEQLVAERVQTREVFRTLARDLHVDSLLLRWLAKPPLARSLGLPRGVRACVFDLDGVLTASANTHAAAWIETFDPFLLERATRTHRPFIAFDPRRDYDDTIAGRPRLDGIRAFLASRGISLPEGSRDDPPDAETVHGLANRKAAALQRHLEREGVAAFAGARSYVRAARIAGFGRAVVSPSSNTGPILERAGLAELIDVRVDGNDIETRALRAKPAPDMLFAACAALGVEPHEAAAFETSPSGVAAARFAGFGFVVGVDRGGDTGELRASDADVAVSDPGDLLETAALPYA